MKTIFSFLFAIVTLGRVELCMAQFPSLNFYIFNLYFTTVAWLFSVFSLFLAKWCKVWTPFSPNSTDFIKFLLISIIL